MKFLSLFSGIGGFDLGLERAGMQCVGQVEINMFCQKVLAKHWPNVKRMGDIREVKGNEFGTVELICGGFPCQPFSVAGTQPEAGLDMAERILSETGWNENPNGLKSSGENVVHPKEAVRELSGSSWPRRDGSSNGGADVADGNGLWSSQSQGCEQKQRRRLINSSEVGHENASWLPEPAVGRVVNGVSGRVDRLRALGNAVVPQVVEVIGRAIMWAECRSNVGFSESKVA